MVSQKTRRRTKIGPTLHPRVVFAGLPLGALTREYSMWLVNKIVYIILNSRGNKYLELLHSHRADGMSSYQEVRYCRHDLSRIHAS